MKTFEYKSRWIWYFFWSWLLLIPVLAFWLYHDRSQILTVFKFGNLSELLKYALLTYFILLLIHELLWFLFGRYIITIDQEIISIAKVYGLYTLKKNYVIAEITDLKILYNIKSDPFIRVSMFLSLYAPNKEAVGFNYRGKEKKIGIGALNFDAKEIKLYIENNKNYSK